MIQPDAADGVEKLVTSGYCRSAVFDAGARNTVDLRAEPCAAG